MDRAPALRLLVVLCLALASAGCVFWAPTLDPMRHEVARSLPAVEIRPEIQVNLGRLSMAIAKRIVRAGADHEKDEEALRVASLLRHVSGVEVAIYEVEGLRSGLKESWSKQVSRMADRRGWRVAARTENEGELTSILYREGKQGIESVYVLALDDESLVLARFRGRLDEALADAIALEGSKLPRSIVKEESEAGGES
jgi:hypothetical protein